MLCPDPLYDSSLDEAKTKGKGRYTLLPATCTSNPLRSKWKNNCEGQPSAYTIQPQTTQSLRAKATSALAFPNNLTRHLLLLTSVVLSSTLSCATIITNYYLLLFIQYFFFRCCCLLLIIFCCVVFSLYLIISSTTATTNNKKN